MFKYLFEVEYRDGSIYKQHPEDLSETGDPGKNSFSDVLPRLEEIRLFQLVGDGHIFTVNLEDLHFEIDNIPFIMHDPNVALTNIRLIYFRRTKINATMVGNGLPEEQSREVSYRMGWQANTSDGKNIQQVMEFK